MSRGILLVLALLSMTMAQKSKKHIPPGMHPDLFPEPDFDEESAVCRTHEPCGWYSFSLQTETPVRWMKSWCHCDAKHECVYERTDMRMRVYRQMCVKRSELSEILRDVRVD